MNPDVIASDVPETVETVETVMTEENVESAVNWSEKTLAELVHAFEELVRNEERMKMSKDAEAIKAAFYKRPIKEKAEAGLALATLSPNLRRASRNYITITRRSVPYITGSLRKSARTIWQ